MPHFKRVEFIAKNDAGAFDKFSVSVEIRASGTFYAHVPEKLRVAFPEDHIDLPERERRGFFVTSAVTFKDLVSVIEKAHEEFMRPTVKEEPVIRYNIESHVSFALDKEGRIFPNAGFPGAQWPRKDKSYGEHHASNPSKGGYSLVVGARALLKKTTAYGDNSEVQYRLYYKGGSHLDHDNPAQLLNSWAALDLPEDALEMPYSDEAAMFFYELLRGMAELNRRIQEFTNTPEKLALAISRHSGKLLLAGPREEGRDDG